jgi:hypothetical protein
MLIRMLENADGTMQGRRVAMFAGQVYDADDGEQLIAQGRAERAVDVKAVHGPPEDKALAPQTDKVTKRRGRPPKA